MGHMQGGFIAVNTVLKCSDHNCLCSIINNDQLGGINKCLGSCGPLVITRDRSSGRQRNHSISNVPASCPSEY